MRNKKILKLIEDNLGAIKIKAGEKSKARLEMFKKNGYKITGDLKKQLSDRNKKIIPNI